jgi:hypothetical protein
MGILLKIILFGLVIYYIFKTIGGFVFRLLGGQRQQQTQRQSTQSRRDGEIIIEQKPKDKRQQNGTGSKEGDYIDYEDVK